MNKKMNSTEALSKKFSRIKLSSLNHEDTPNRRPNSTLKKRKQLLEQALIAKNKKLSVMIRNVHHYMTNVQEVQWILDQVEKLVDSYMKKTVNKYGVSHQMQIENLYAELTKLIERFTGIERFGIRDTTVPLKPHPNTISQNINWINMRKDTIGSFKYTDFDQTENQEDGPSDFSRINLPTIVKQNASMQNMNSDHQQNQQEIRQYKSTIQILSEEIDKLNNEKQQIKLRYQQKIGQLKKEVGDSLMNWESYRGYAVCSLQRCKKLLGSSSVQGDIQRLLNQLFAWENRLDKNLQVSDKQLQQQKGRYIRELSQLEWKIREKKFELERPVLQITPKLSMDTMQQNHVQSKQSWSKILLMQATTIEQLLDISN